MFRLLSVIFISILTGLIVNPTNAISWSCFNPGGQTVNSSCAILPELTPTPIYSTGILDLQPIPLDYPSPSPTPTPSLSPIIDEPSPEPSSLSPLPTDTPQPSTSPEVPVVPNQEPSEPDPVVLSESLTPEPSQLPDVQDTLEVVVDSSPSVSPSSLPSLEKVYEEIPSPSSIDKSQGLLSFLPELSLESLQETFQQISESISSALSTVSNLGSEFTPEERREAQQVVLAAIIVTQLSTSTRRIK